MLNTISYITQWLRLTTHYTQMCTFVIASDDTGNTMVPALEQKRGYTAWRTCSSAAGHRIIILETGHSSPIKKILSGFSPVGVFMWHYSYFLFRWSEQNNFTCIEITLKSKCHIPKSVTLRYASVWCKYKISMYSARTSDWPLIQNIFMAI
jgi:hypothetical protein